MAINIYTEPVNLTSPYRPYYFDCSSDLGTISRMIADVYVGSTLVTTIDADPIIGQTDQFRFEVGEVVTKQLTSEFNEVSSFPEVFNCTTSATDIYIRAFEVYTSGSLLDTSWSEAGAGTGYTQSTTLNVANGVLQHEQKDDGANYSLSSSTGLFGTNRPQNIAVSNNQYFLLGGLTTDPDKKVRVVEYDGFNGSGSTVATTDSSAQAPSFQSLNFGIDTSDLDSTTKSFSFQVLNVTNTPMSSTFVANVVTPCDDDVVLYWQNHYGRFDTHLFKGKFLEKTKTRTRSIEKRLDKSFNFEDRGLTDITKENERTFEVYSDIQGSDAVKWLAEIGESVDVRIQKTINGAKETIPINVTSVSSTIEDSERGIFQIRVSYTLSNQRINPIG